MRTVQLMGRLLCGLVLLTGIALVTVLLIVPRVTGSTPLTVLTGSMTPTIPVGSVVLVKPVDPLSLQPGDVITFQAEPGVQQFVTHRIVRFQPDTTPPSYITKGDANRGEDVDPVPVGAIRGKVWFHVPYVGSASSILKGPGGMGLLSAGAGLAILVWLGRTLVGRRRPSSLGSPLDAVDDAPAERVRQLS